MVKLGLNLSFAVKRWLNPVQLAKMIKNDFKIDHVQFTWDLIDPWWPEEYRDVMARQYREAFCGCRSSDRRHIRRPGFLLLRTSACAGEGGRDWRQWLFSRGAIDLTV